MYFFLIGKAGIVHNLFFFQAEPTFFLAAPTAAAANTAALISGIIGGTYGLSLAKLAKYAHNQTILAINLHSLSISNISTESSISLSQIKKFRG